MKKITLFFFFILMAQTLSFGSTPGRGPSVEPLMEIDIETDKPENASGYDFNNHQAQTPVTAPVTKRVPANITTKHNSNSASSYLGPLLFLLTLPIALWILVSKRFKGDSSDKEVGYYAKMHQFPRSKPQYQSSDEDSDDIFPKAS